MNLKTNIAALGAIRNLNSTTGDLNRASERLSSGLRINRASDDAAGLAIAATLRADVRTLGQAVRNVNDGISLINIADGALSQLSEILQRCTEIAEQAANGVYSVVQKQPLQIEMEALLSEVDRIAETTHFNGLKLFPAFSDQDSLNASELINSLKSTWLEQSEILITAHYGLTADGATLTVRLVDNDPQYLASVSGTVGPGGVIQNQFLNIDLGDFVPATLPNGGTAPFYDDRIIAHEMAHAIMGRTMNFAALPTWFIEGTAEFIHGADERLYSDIFLNGGLGGTGAANVADQIDLAWSGTSLQYSAGYAGVRYLHDRIKTAGGTGIRDIMDYLSTNAGSTLNDALINIANGSYVGGVADFYTDFKTNGNGAAFILGLEGAALLNADTGAIDGSDADGGAVRNAEDVIPDIVNYTENPLAGFAEVFPDISIDSDLITFAVGIRGDDYISIRMTSMSTSSLNINGIDVVENAGEGLDRLKAAIQVIVRDRGKLGAFQSRFETAQNAQRVMAENFTAAESRIMDADVAVETANLLRTRILREAGAAILAQANQQPAQALRLLEG